MDQISPEQAANEMRIGLATLTAAYQVLSGVMSADQGGQAVGEMLEDTFAPGEAPAVIWAVSAVALRALQLAADELGTDVPALLARLGAEIG